jgi:hypothetical protein
MKMLAPGFSGYLCVSHPHGPTPFVHDYVRYGQDIDPTNVDHVICVGMKHIERSLKFVNARLLLVPCGLRNISDAAV